MKYKLNDFEEPGFNESYLLGYIRKWEKRILRYKQGSKNWRKCHRRIKRGNKFLREYKAKQAICS